MSRRFRGAAVKSFYLGPGALEHWHVKKIGSQCVHVSLTGYTCNLDKTKLSRKKMKDTKILRLK